MEAYERGSGRPRKDGLVRDKDGNLRDPEGFVIEDPSTYVPPQDVASANEEAADSSELDALREQLAQMQEQINQANPQVAQPNGKWNVNYRAKHLRVHGGVEVAHQPGFRPPPPSSIKMYVAEDGTYTDHIEQPMMAKMKYDSQGNPQMGEDGMPVFTRYPIAKAAKIVNGEPVLTPEYKHWLHVRSSGGRINSTVMSDIAAGKGLPSGASAPAMSDGIPVTLDE